ncbi:HAD family hydrolase [Siphonobacter sp. BAB-5385]|uniref:HAD family hydrolase n=1 Tax=Siphonobacter sp. BAB-5385 TaxID=1864822 RepID=UPI000B9E4393|nr:HAD family hydrolase [Siphonobacter sp. BAB-5385]OZI07861.1 HAD family hydrolase [Siphonobacter sp. BAB-5385]
MSLKVIAFDADDTLWVNEPYFQETERKFCALLEDFLPHHTVSQELFKTEIANLAIYGYGVKGFMLAMIETALTVTDYNVRPEVIAKAIEYGKELLQKPIELLDGVQQTLSLLKDSYRLVVATKGDLLDQERKLKKSGLEHFFHHIEIMSDKKEADYLKLIKHLDIKPEEFMMIGNSIKSDVLPVLNIGGQAIHVPYHTTWLHEQIEHKLEHPNFRTAKHLNECLACITSL